MITSVVVGLVVYKNDQFGHGSRRAYLVVSVDACRRYQVVPFSHTPQGLFSTDELGGGTYVAGKDFRTGRWTGTWVGRDEIRVGSRRRQMTAATASSALTYNANAGC